MKKILFIVAVSLSLTAKAQNYLITFTGTGASTNVNTVKVENLTKGTTLTINGSDILRLTGATGVNSIVDNKTYALKIYPNPITDNSTLEVSPPVAGNAVITVYEMTGKPVAQIQSNLENVRQEYKISGVKNGLYIISIKGNNYQLSGIFLSNSKSNGTIRIEKVNSIIQASDEKEEVNVSKGTLATVDMAYTNGDRLKFTGISGNYGTVKTDIPTSDKTITFNFIACTDADNNNYPVVEIGSQVWMAENLKTTKYNDGVDIPNLIENSIWQNPAGAYCWYNNNLANKEIYGALYNWHTISTNKLCPIGWHVPTDNEWTTLATHLGGTAIAGFRLKETGIIHWSSSNANNESGFTARPGGYRDLNGPFGSYRSNGMWWSATAMSDGYYSGSWYMAWYSYQLFRFVDDKRRGFSVRCLKNITG